MASNIGYNIEEAVVKNTPKLLSHLEKMAPVQACLCFGVDTALKLRGVGVQRPIVRLYGANGDAGTRRTQTPDQVMTLFDNVRRNNLFGEYTNEDGLQAAKVIELLRVSLARGFKWTVPGIAVGNLNASDLDSYNQVLDWMVEFPDQLRFSFHNYYAGRPDIGQDGIQNAYQQPMWSPDSPKPGPPSWTIGREYEMIKAHQDGRGKPIPGMDCTEFGLGNVTAPNFGNIPGKQWGAVDGKPQYYDVNYGWLADSEYFKQQWPQWSPARTYAKQIIWADQNYFRPYGIPLMIYCYGADEKRPPGSEQDWLPFNVEGYDEILEEFEEYAKMAVNPPVDNPPPPPVEPPAVAGYPEPVARPAGDGVLSKLVSVAKTFANIRTGPGTDWKDVGDIFPGAEGMLYRDPSRTDWVYFEAPLTAAGWVSLSVATFTDLVIEPPPPSSPPPVEPPAPALMTPLTADELQQLANFHSSIAAIYTAAYNRLTGVTP